MFNINIDTVVLHFGISSKKVNLNGWLKKTNKKKEKIYTKKTELAYYSCNVTTYYLTVKLSPQKLKKGSNEKDYNWLITPEIIEKIKKDLREAIQSDSINIADAMVCRADLNTIRRFKNEKDAEALIDFFERSYVPRAMAITKYSKDSIAFKYAKSKKIELRVYRKDIDPHIPEEVRKNMDPTVRIEFQYNQAKKVREFFGTDNFLEIMYNPELSQIAWNKMLTKYRLDAAVLNHRQFFRVAFNILGVKDNTFKKYKKIFLKFWKKEKLTVEEKRTYNRITHQLYLAGVASTYSDVDFCLMQNKPVKLIKRLWKKIIREIFLNINRIKNENKRNANEINFKKFNYIRYKRFDTS